MRTAEDGGADDSEELGEVNGSCCFVHCGICVVDLGSCVEALLWCVSPGRLLSDCGALMS